ncbi:MAG TPA: ABC transporter ATP-binding protein, partial [Euryarchaeota archaeon]|nr:ABC transporter ATP-binding protein [Euryarchaeota archaeon]
MCDSPEPSSMPTPVIKIESLTKKYGVHVGVEHLDLTVDGGEVFGLLGPNGAGKSTTIRVCLDLIRKTEGSVKIFGMDSEEKSMEIRRRTGYLPGDFGLIPKFTVKDYLKYLLSLNDLKDTSYMEALAGRLDLDLNRRTEELSKGNRQKVGIVQAFMTKPQLAILDEPTSGLDPLIQQEFQRIVREERAK